MKHIIFDMDGVIVDTEPEYKKRTEHFFRQKGFDISDELYNLTCGSNMKETYELFKKRVKGFRMDYEAYVQEKRALYQNQPIDARECVDKEIYDLLEWLKKQDFHIALASSSSPETITRYLAQLGIEEYFEMYVSGSWFERSKPDPAIYLYTMEKMKVEPSQCVVVEDSTYGITAARAAGAIVIAKKDERFAYDQSGADYLITSLPEIKKVIEEVIGR